MNAKEKNKGSGSLTMSRPLKQFRSFKFETESMNSRKEEYETLVKRIGELEGLINNAKSKKEHSVKKEIIDSSGRQQAEMTGMSMSLQNVSTSQHTGSSHHQSQGKSVEKVESSASSVSHLKSAQMSSNEIRKQLVETEQKIVNLKETLYQLKADKQSSSLKVSERKNLHGSVQKREQSSGTREVLGHGKAGDAIRDSSIRHAENQLEGPNVERDSLVGKTSVRQSVMAIKPRNNVSVGLRVGNDQSKGKTVKQQVLSGNFAENNAKRMGSFSDSTRNSVSATPISDLITRNLQRQQTTNKLSSTSSKYVTKNKLQQTLVSSGIQNISKPSSSQRGPSQSKKSITPITDLVDQNIAVRRQQSQGSKSSAISVTPISDLITRNIEKSSPKKHEKKNTASNRRTPKGPKFPASSKWTKTQNLRSCRTPTSLKMAKNVRETKNSFSPGQMKWTRRSSSGETVPSFKSPAQKLAYVIKNKYKLVKDNPGSYMSSTGHLTTTRSIQKRGVHTMPRNQWMSRSRSHGGHPGYYSSAMNRKGRGLGRQKASYRSRFQASWSHYSASYSSKANYKITLQQHRWQKGGQRYRYKLDRRGDPVFSAPSVLDGQRLVMMNGTVYRTSGRGLTITRPGRNIGRRNSALLKTRQYFSPRTIVVRGVKFQMDADGKTLKRLGHAKEKYSSRRVARVDFGGVTYVQKTPDVLEKVTNTSSIFVASQVLDKSIRTATARFRKDNTKLAKKYCKFYNRFGRCRRGDNCQFIHDPSKIAVCTRFLRGTCNITDCPFSHKVDKDKMPVCSYFLKGVCNRDNCAYLHVNVDRNAEICLDFINGFCPFGEKCKKKHTRVCPAFSRTGRCPDGKDCRLTHRQTWKRRKPLGAKCRKEESHETDDEKPKSDTRVDDEDDVDIPFKMRKLPTFISLTEYSETPIKDSMSQRTTHEERRKGEGSGLNKTDTVKMKIKPQF